MIERIAADIAGRGPLRISRVDYVDPTVVLAGEDWALAITCPARFVHESSVIAEWADDDVFDKVWDLVGQSIVEARLGSTGNPTDPVFLLTNDYRIEIEADSDWDPWVLHVPGFTYVGSVTKP